MSTDQTWVLPVDFNGNSNTPIIIHMIAGQGSACQPFCISSIHLGFSSSVAGIVTYSEGVVPIWAQREGVRVLKASPHLLPLLRNAGAGPARNLIKGRAREPHERR